MAPKSVLRSPGPNSPGTRCQIQAALGCFGLAGVLAILLPALSPPVTGEFLYCLAPRDLDNASTEYRTSQPPGCTERTLPSRRLFLIQI